MNAVLFDFGGTLDADGVPWKERFFRLCTEEGIRVSRERFDPIFYAIDDGLVGAIPPSLSLPDTVGRLAAGIVAALAPSDQTMTARISARFLASVHAQLDGHRPLLERLGRRYQLGIVSNFYGNLATVCDNLGIRPLFNVIVDSTQAGFTKPDPRIFRKAVEALGVAPAAATFVGDSLARDMAGARAIGMRHVWLAGDVSGSAGPCCPGDHVVKKLGDVEALLL